MIEIRDVAKSFGEITALASISTDIREQEVFGLVGTNGAGKSTLLRLLSGVLQPDSGEIRIDGESVYENQAVKSRLCFLPDTGFFPINATAFDMMKTYQLLYPDFSMERCVQLLGRIGLDLRRKIRTYSKGMKKQLSVALGLCANTKYLFCDETFDGLDPVMRQAVKSLFAAEMLDRAFVPVIASHNLRELEDICDHVGLLHKGGILFSENLEEMKFHMQKIQCVLSKPEQEEQLCQALSVITKEKRGSMLTFVAKGTEEEILGTLERFQPIFAESIPLTLEEIFLTETEVAGYDIQNILG